MKPQAHDIDEETMASKSEGPNRFRDLLTRLVRVQKREIDEQERRYQEKRETDARKRAPETADPEAKRH